MKPNVKTEIGILEKNDEKVAITDRDTLFINSHWHRSNLIIIEYKETKVTVSGADLLAAVQNALNSRTS